ncbi:hypothetical protein ASE57_15570 [Sphingomonas sp. Leaf11]|nr:hypothetical protein ASE58_15570 [Sphingomonas sp. Leaf9]KQM42468.1 hypothetical protein ASE57_15570 [Sphingomonas sp. Leaf11]
MKGLGAGVVLVGLIVFVLGLLQTPLGDMLVRPASSAEYLAALQNKALLTHTGLAFLIMGTVVSTGAAIVDAIKRR